MNVIFSPSAHATGAASGFYLIEDKNAPKDSFPVTDDAHKTAINLPDGATYFFSSPVAPDIYGKLLVTEPSKAFLLTQAKSNKNQELQLAYSHEIVSPVSYTSLGGIAETYDADATSVGNLQSLLIALSSAPDSLPPGFFWVSSDNTQVPFVYEDMQGLAKVMAARGIGSFIKLQGKKALVGSATSVEEVREITWE